MSQENKRVIKITLRSFPACWVIIVNKHDTEIEIKAEMGEIHERHLQFSGISGLNGFGLNGISGFGIS